MFCFATRNKGSTYIIWCIISSTNLFQAACSRQSIETNLSRIIAPKNVGQRDTPRWKSQSTELKWRTLKACIFPVAIYGCEAWTISKNDEKKITSFEMKCYRKILRISWTERKTNASVLEQLGVKAPQLLNLIKKQKLSYTLWSTLSFYVFVNNPNIYEG